MRTAIFIPIKKYSERVKGKNFQKVGNKTLYQIIIDKCASLSENFDCYVDTDSEDVKDYALSKYIRIIPRKPELAKDNANGNDLLNYHYSIFPNYQIYMQLFCTSPFLKKNTILVAENVLQNSNDFDSCFTTRDNYNWFWFGSQPVNYLPNILPRSQDARPVTEETTALYAIRGSVLNKYKSRIGARPAFIPCNKIESVDINDEIDLKYANFIYDSILTKEEKSLYLNQ